MTSAVMGRLVEVLGPDFVIARSSHTLYDEELALWGVAVDIGLGVSRARVAGAGIIHVGAGGFQRTDTMIRAAGEAVERFALMPNPQDEPVEWCEGHDVRRGAIDWSMAGRAAPGIARSVPCRTGLLGDTELLVPTCLIDDPSPTAQLAEASPSGAAAGSSIASAARGALLESVERDAVQAFWALRPQLDYLDHAQVLKAVTSVRPDGRGLSAALTAPGLKIQCVLIPAHVNDLTVVLALVTDQVSGGIVAAGSAVGPDVAIAAARAGREAIQVLSLLRALRRTAGSVWATAPAAYPVTDELSRARFWSEPGSDRQLVDVIANCRPLAEAPAPGINGTPSSEELARTLTVAGLSPVLVNLTDRLPAPVRELGWHAVKAIIVGHQPLRMDETLDYNWCRPRLSEWARRWHCSPHPNCLPHPLI